MIEPPCRMSISSSRGAVEHPVQPVDPEAGAGEQFGQLGGVELAGVERVDRVSLPGVKVMRFGVEISSSPPGRNTRKHSVMNCG